MRMLLLILFTLRVPLLCALLIAGLAPLGAYPFSPFHGLLEGLFDVSGWGAVWVGLAAWLAVSACWISAVVTLNYAPRRLPGFGPLSRQRRRASAEEFHPFPQLALVLALAPASVIAGVLFVSESKLAVAIGAVAGVIVYGAAWLPLRSFRRPLFIASRRMRRLLALDPAGYRDPASGHLLSGHLFAAQFAALFLSLYTTVGVAKYYALIGGGARAASLLPPSLAYLLLLIGLLALVFSGLAFFFDRYRVPVLLPWCLLLSLTSLVPTSDHYVETVPARKSDSLPLDSPTPILVCASGGGIQASAWTAAVLTGLERQSPGLFSRSLRLFSGASGGSVGGMHFLAAYDGQPGRKIDPAALDQIFHAASRSSLDAVAWGLVGPDLLRATVPFAGSLLGPIGRGWALEQAWDPARRLRRPLADWSKNRPAIVFNATEVESGRGVPLGTLHTGLSPVTAARLSASFPYVTPAPRVNERTHFADGGYYDNYGVTAAVAFLQQLESEAGVRHILLIEIRASQSANPAAPAANTPSSPLLFQWLAPLATILNVRDAAQREHNDATISLLTRVLAAQGIRLERVLFEAPRRDVPLSWHLTSSQIEAVRRDWQTRFANSPESAAVARFLRQPHNNRTRFGVE